MTVHCAICGHAWELPLRFPMPIDQFVQATQTAALNGCPICSAYGRSVLCGPAPVEQPKGSTA